MAEMGHEHFSPPVEVDSFTATSKEGLIASADETQRLVQVLSRMQRFKERTLSNRLEGLRRPAMMPFKGFGLSAIEFFLIHRSAARCTEPFLLTGVHGAVLQEPRPSLWP